MIKVQYDKSSIRAEDSVDPDQMDSSEARTKPADLDLQCFRKKRDKSRFSRTRIKIYVLFQIG